MGAMAIFFCLFNFLPASFLEMVEWIPCPTCRPAPAARKLPGNY
jgi:hypothetical protein